MAFFDSEIVQEEAKRLFGDYQQLMQLGGAVSYTHLTLPTKA